MIFYNPETNITLDKKELSLKYNTCLPEDIEEFEGWYRLYYDTAPDHSEYQVIKENPIVLVNGKYRQSFRAETRSLDDIKSMRINEVARKFKEVEDTAHLLSSVGFIIDANERANRDIDGLIKVLSEEGLESTTFRDYNNNDREVSLTNLKDMHLEVLKNGQYLYQQKWNYLKLINSAEDTDSLIGMSIEFQNMSFGD